MPLKIAYQGEPGANSHIACIEAYPDFEPLSCRTFEDAFQACIAHLRLFATHSRATRTTNLLERQFIEERRRLKIIPNGFGEKAVL